jgi:hypothetical protein
MKSKTVGWAGFGVFIVAAAFVWWAAHDVTAEIRRQGRIARSLDNLRTLLLYDVGLGSGTGPGHERHELRYGGKRWFLRLVATNAISKSDPKQLEILFSPGDDARSLEKAGGPKAYERLTFETLDDPAFDPSALTSYVGPRLDEKGPKPPSATSPDGDPIVADLTIPGAVILGFPGGKVRWLDAQDLGLPPDRPIVVGDASPNELLRHLSDR